MTEPRPEDTAILFRRNEQGREFRRRAVAGELTPHDISRVPGCFHALLKHLASPISKTTGLPVHCTDYESTIDEDGQGHVRGLRARQRVFLLEKWCILGFVVYRGKRLASCGVIAPSHFEGRSGWGPVVPGVCTVHRLFLTPTVTTFEHHAALCPPINFLLVAKRQVA